MDLTPATLRDVEFREKLRGYHPDDVDDFLEEVAVAVETLLYRLHDAEDAAAGMPARPTAPVEQYAPPPVVAVPVAPPAPVPPPPAPVPQPAPVARVASSPEHVSDDTLRRTLLLAQRTADLAVAEAEDAARELLEHAQSEAARIRDEARIKAEAVLTEAEGRKAGLEREIAAMTGWAVQHRDRLRDALTEQMRSLDVWLGASTPPVAVRAGFSRTGAAAARRSLGTAPRALSGAAPGADAGASSTDASPPSEAEPDAPTDHEEPTDDGHAFSTRVFRRR